MARARIAALSLVLLLAVVLLGGGVYLSDADRACRMAEQGLGWPEGSITVDEVDLMWSGRFRIENLRVHPPQKRMPIVNIAWAEADIPTPLQLYKREIYLGDVQAGGVDIGLRMQRPPPVERELRGKPYTLHADSLVLGDSRFTAAEDEPFPEVSIADLQGSLTAIRWTPALKHIEGVGTARSGRFVLGDIELEDLVIPTLVLADEGLVLRGGTFRYGRTEGTVDGTITDLPGDPAVELHAKVRRGRVEEAIEDAIGRVSPVTGWLDVELTVHAGGELGRGESRMDGYVSLYDGFVFMGTDVKLIPRLLLDVAPWFDREGGGWLSVGHLWGQASFGRGWVEIERLERLSKRNQPLQAWGELRDGHVDVTVRTVPRRRPDKPGVGVRLRGPLRSAKLKFAKRSELMDAPEVLIVE